MKIRSRGLGLLLASTLAFSGLSVAAIPALTGGAAAAASPSDVDVHVPNESLTDSGAVILNNGHVDVASKVHDDTLETWVKDTTESSDARYHPLAGSHSLDSGDRSATNNGNGTVFQVLPEAKATLPDNSTYAFLGHAGDPVWQVSQTQQEGLLWPGWSTEEIPLSATKAGVTWKLDKMEGPGEFALYETELSTIDVLFNTRDGITSADSIDIAKNSHVHGSWAFSAEGTYCLGFSRSTTMADGAKASDDFTLAVAVGRVAVKKVDPGACFSDAGKPSGADTSATPESQLTASTAGDVQVQGGAAGFGPGQLVTIQAGTAYADRWVSPWLYATGEEPVWLGWTQADSSGAIRVRTPVDTPPGAHKIAVESEAGDLLGWDGLTLVKADDTGGDGSGGDGSGGDGSGGNPPGDAPGGSAPPQCTAQTTIISQGHLDYSTQVIGGKVESLIGDNSSGTEVFREPSRTVLWLKPSSLTKLPAGYPEIGAQGTNVYMVPQTQDMSLIWLGWSTETLNSSKVSGPVTWDLTKVDGPGSVKVFIQGQFGGVQTLVFNGASSYQIPLDVHAHANWAFSAPGVYRLHFTQSVTLKNGKRSSDSEVLTLVVGNVDPATAVPGGAACVGDTKTVKTKNDGSHHKKHKKNKKKNKDKASKKGTPSQDSGGATTATQCLATGTTGGSSSSSSGTTAATKTTVLSFGHMDWGSHITNGKLESLIGDDSSGSRVYREPSQTVLWLKPESKITLPAGFSQIGAAGSTAWQIPQTQNMNLVWMGWSTELLNAGNAAGPVTWKLTKIDGPGTVKVYTTGSFGGVENMVFNGTGSYTIALGVHAHANWAFSKQGVYRLHFTQSVTLKNGKRSSDSEVMTVAVGDLDPSKVSPTVEAGSTGTTSDSSTPASSQSGDCGSSVSGPTDSAVAAAAETQAQPPAATGVLPSVTQPVTQAPGAVTAATAPVKSGSDPVPLLLGVLAGLLLIGAGGGGFWWGQRRAAVDAAMGRGPRGHGPAVS